MASIVERVKANPGKTASEYREFAEKQTTTRWALYNAKREGKLIQSGTKICSVTKRRAATWFPSSNVSTPAPVQSYDGPRRFTSGYGN